MSAKLDTAGVFERLFAVYRTQFTLIVPAAFVVFLPVAILNGAFAAGGELWLALIGALLSVAATFLLQGMVIEAVRDIQDGRRDFTIGGLFRSVLPVLPMLVGIGLLAGLGIALGFLLLIVPGLVLLTWWAVVGPSVVIERRGIDAFGRSRDLVRGNAWQVFGVIVVVFLIQLVADTALAALFGGDSFAGQGIASLLSGALVAPIAAIAAALVYLELRALKGEAPPPAGGDAPAAEPSPFGTAPEAPPPAR
ncbi:MAG TPA: hypothetical protein VHF89_07100 [Solirubrobacteraceae bacterium]|nr:hypothetical protein [Solirubrobacteraceae bacterium]